MRPVLMKGHERPLTFLKYNPDGDILVSCAKDLNPTAWFATNGERLGTYIGHKGAVWSCDISKDSSRLITGSADQTMKLWNFETGEPLFTYEFEGPARSVSYSEGEKLVLVSVDPFMGSMPAMHVKRISKTGSDEKESVLKITLPNGKVNRCVWGPLNETIVGAGEDGVVRMWNTETGKLLRETDVETSHSKTVTSLSLSADGAYFITGSLDKTAKLWDIRTLELLKTYQSERPINTVAISPLLDHVAIGGGQDAAMVTTTSSRAGKFEAMFYHTIFEMEIGRVKGHFGPLNAIAFSPDGRSYASGGEDGYVRLHHFDTDYFSIKV